MQLIEHLLLGIIKTSYVTKVNSFLKNWHWEDVLRSGSTIHAQNALAILGSLVNVIGGDLCDLFKVHC